MSLEDLANELLESGKFEKFVTSEEIISGRSNCSKPSSEPIPKRWVYLSGKMSGEPNHGFPLFHEYDNKYTAKGFGVVNPAHNAPGKTWEEYLIEDISKMLNCQDVVVLPNWKESKGANLEVFVAHAVGMKIIQGENGRVLPADEIVESVKQWFPKFFATAGDAEEEAPSKVGYKLTNGPRQKDYGHPLDDFTCTADIWNALIRKRYPGTEVTITAEDVASFMIALKLTREFTVPKKDNVDDIVGYADCKWMVRQEAKRRRRLEGKPE